MKNLPFGRDEELDEMKRVYAAKRLAIKSRLAEFAAVPPSEHFYELVYCLLTPQSSAVHAEQVVTNLRDAHFQSQEINPEFFLRQKECYIRFHKTKARHLLRLKEQFSIISEEILKPIPAMELREWLVKDVLGLGLKEATHFLRNIGKNNGLAILDRHILRTLQRLKVIREVPDSLSRKHYLRIEQRFSDFAEHIGIPLDELDLLFWSIETGEIRK
jgi:N-glycosylase/DNA lyase